MMCNSSKLDLVKINAHTKLGNILSICSQDIESKLKYKGQNDKQNYGQPKSSVAPLFQGGAILKKPRDYNVTC